MRIPIKNGKEIVLTDIGTMGPKKFIIKECIGRGATCLVYSAVCEDKTEHILREFYPKSLDITRAENGEITPSKKDFEEFNEALKIFEKSCYAQKEFRLDEKLKNYIFDVKGYYNGNGTKYVSMSKHSGTDYSKVEEKNLYDLLLRIKTLTKVVGHYHKKGFLHLDIKPENIFVRPEDETKEDIMLFDFGSILSITEAKKGIGLSYTKDWSAPEQVIPNRYTEIGPATDVFSIGEIIFFKIFNRHSKGIERWSIADFEFEKKNMIFENTDDKVFEHLKDLFRHTICNLQKNRYQSIDELIEKINEIIPLANPKASRLIQNEVVCLNNFVGRNKELEQISSILKDDDILFIKGMGGIGKSELVKQYIKLHKSEHSAIIFAPFVSDFKSMLADDNVVRISNMSMYFGEKAEQYAERKFKKLQELSDENTLFVIDNFDVDFKNNDKQKKYLKLLLEIKGKKIITTRNDFGGFGKGKHLEVKKMENREDIKEIFKSNYGKTINDNLVDEIIDLVDGHTMAVELIAKQLNCDYIEPEEMLEILKKNLIAFGDGVVPSGKDNNMHSADIYTHISSLFDISIFEKPSKETELYVLQNLSLIPHTGVKVKSFVKWCSLEKRSIITELKNGGWIREENSLISLHPVIAEVVRSRIKTCVTSLSILDGVVNYTKSESFEKLNSSERSGLALLCLYMSNILRNIDIKTQNISEFLVAAQYIYFPYGHLEDRIDNLNYSIKIAEEININVERVAYFYCELGVAYRDIENHFQEAKSALNKSLKLRLQNFGEINSGTATSYFNLGLLYQREEKYDEALEYIIRALDIRKKVFGEESLQVVKCYSALGEIKRLKNRYDEAEKYQLKALEVQQKLSVAEINKAITYNRLGLLYRDTKNFELSEEYFFKVLKIREEKLGKYHFETAITYSCLASLYKEMNLLDKAMELVEIALKTQKMIFGEGHKRTCYSQELLLEIKNSKNN